MHNQFHTFFNYWGLLGDYPSSSIYGFENISEGNKSNNLINIPKSGACFGYVFSGMVFISLEKTCMQVNSGWWFSISDGTNMITTPNCRMVVFQTKGYNGVDACGRLEPEGRLGYIDGCMNSVLSGPNKKGDPVLNALYMPTAIHQTMHTHPSLRAGMIISGNGTCNTPKEVINIDYSEEKHTECIVHDLMPGAIFILPEDGWHKFRTDITDSSLSLVAYHPDSDFGPTDEEAPMLNRTMIGEQGNQISAKSRTHLLTKNGKV